MDQGSDDSASLEWKQISRQTRHGRSGFHALRITEKPPQIFRSNAARDVIETWSWLEPDALVEPTRRRVTRDTAELAEKELAEIGRFLLAVEPLEGGNDRMEGLGGGRRE